VTRHSAIRTRVKPSAHRLSGIRPRAKARAHHRKTGGAQGQTGQAQSSHASSTVTLTTEQRTKIRETVLAGRNAPRVPNVNFNIAVGTTVPSTVQVVEVPEVIVEIHPEWRRFYYFVVGDEIIIVDLNHKIVAVIAV
jgi:hypothetical protein